MMLSKLQAKEKGGGEEKMGGGEEKRDAVRC